MPAQEDLVRHDRKCKGTSDAAYRTNENVPEIMVADSRVYQNQLQIRMGDFQVWALIDSGANISVMSVEMANKIRYSCPQSERPDFTMVKGVGGEVHRVTEKLTVRFWINSVAVHQTFHVIDGHQSVILGMDFLQSQSAVVDFGTNQLKIRGGNVNLTHPAIRSSLARTISSMIVPAKSEMTVPVRCSKQYCNAQLLLKPTGQSELSGIAVTPTLVYVNGSKTYCRVINSTHTTVRLPSHFTLAHAQVVPGSDISSIWEPDTEDICSVEQVADIEVDIENDNVTETDRLALVKFLEGNRHVFAKNKSELGFSSIITHTIDTQGAKAVTQRFYRTSPEKRAEIDRQVEENLELGLVEPSTSEWRSPVVLVKKADGGWRLCCDYRKLNAVTRPQSFPLPRLEDVWDAIGEKKATIFSTLDFSNSFHQLGMDPQSAHKTAFLTQNGQFQWNVLPYGLVNSPVTFTRAMHEILREHLFKTCIIYVDDIIVYSRNMKEHMGHLKEIFKCIAKAGLRLKPSKCRFAAKEVKYLGHILSGDGVRPNPEKTAIVDNFPVPKNEKQVRSFLGLTNYYKRFIRDYSKVAAPMFALLRKEVPFVWGSTCQKAFDYLKTRLAESPILMYPDMAEHFYLTTDASSSGLAYILSQKDESGGDHAIAYGGRALRGPETRYTVSELEYLAIKEGIEAYHPYLADKPFTVYTDHKPLKYATKFRPDGGRLGRWALFLQNYNFTTQYKTGKSNSNADSLSRIPIAEPSQDDTAQQADSHPTVELCSIEPLDMVRMQRQCPLIRPFYQFHHDDILPKDNKLANIICRTQDKYIIDEDGLLYHITFPGNRRKPEMMIKQLVVPKCQQHAVITSHHDNLMGGGHQGIDRTFASISLRAYWPGMYKTIEEYVKSCGTCQKVKHQNRKPALLTPMPIASVFERWHMDFLCMKATPEGYKYILLLVDSFSRWCEAIPTKCQDAKTVAEILYKEIFTRYGTPKEIVSDLGRQFTSKLVRALCELGGAKQKFTSPYHPQCNATCERMNSFIIQSVRAYCDSDQNDWPSKLPGIMMAYRSTPATRSTGLSPYQLVFGRIMVTPSDVDLLPKKSLPEAVQQHLNNLVTSLKVFKEVAEDNVKINQERYKTVHDRKATNKQFHMGDKVLMSNPAVPVGLVPKLFPPYKGPYRIIDVGPNNTYRLEDGGGKVLTHLIHANRLAAFVERQQEANHTLGDPIATNTVLNDDTTVAGHPTSQQLNENIHDIDTEDMEPDNLPPPPDDPPTQDNGTTPPTLEDADVGDKPPTPVPKIITGIEKAVRQNNRLYYKVSVKGQKYRPWVWKEDVPDHIREQFHQTKTMKGTSKKLKRSTTYFTKPCPEAQSTG